MTRLKAVLNSVLGALTLSKKKSEGRPRTNKIKIFIGTWNMHGKLPPDICQFIEPPVAENKLSPGKKLYLKAHARHPYHLVVIGTQEFQHNIEVFPSKKEWEKRLVEHLSTEYTLLKTESMAAMHLAVFVWNGCKEWVRGFQHAQVATGLADLFGNKGGVGISVLFGNKSFLFINSHLAAHQNKVKERAHDFRRISKEIHLRGYCKDDKHKKNVTGRYDYTFWFGDMNYRVNLTRAQADAYIAKDDFSALLAHDQLSHELKSNDTFEGFHEGQITFPPTFKLDVPDQSSRSLYNERHSVSRDDVGYKPRVSTSALPDRIAEPSMQYDTSEKQRVPSWTDRILWKARDPSQAVEVSQYTAVTDMPPFSDHRPVIGCFLADFDWEQDIHSLAQWKRHKKNNSVLSYLSGDSSDTDDD